MYGHNFGGGRGNVTLQAEYNHEQRVFGSDIPWYRHADGFVVSDVDAGLLPSQHNSDGFPDRVFVRDIRSSTISAYGLVPCHPADGRIWCRTKCTLWHGTRGHERRPLNHRRDGRDERGGVYVYLSL